MGKWTRRAFIGTGISSGGTLLVGVAIRPGNRSGKVTEVTGEVLIIPHMVSSLSLLLLNLLAMLEKIHISTGETC